METKFNIAVVNSMARPAAKKKKDLKSVDYQEKLFQLQLWAR